LTQDRPKVPLSFFSKPLLAERRSRFFSFAVCQYSFLHTGCRRSLPYIVVFLAFYSAFMMLPFIGMFYGLHEWTERHLGFGARTIAIIDTMADAPMGQVAMIPMLAWIAKEAPSNQQATYFAVMAAFTNLALSASHLATRYLNQIFVIERGPYAQLGQLLITVALLALAVPIITVAIVRPCQGKPHVKCAVSANKQPRESWKGNAIRQRPNGRRRGVARRRQTSLFLAFKTVNRYV
jgi:hypothetical protein